MGTAATYFRNIKDAVTSIFDGMAVSASHLIRRPYTIQYPDRIAERVQDTLPFRYRGILDVDMEICTGCLACDRACPIDCIAIAIEKNAQTREIVISQFDIDIAKCMYCGLCSEPCPTGAIHHTTEFEGADYSLESLIRRFITEPVVAYKAKKGPEPDVDVAKLLDRGMKYVDEWAQPGSDKPPATAKPAVAGAKPGVAPKPASAAQKPIGAAAKPIPPPRPITPEPASATAAVVSADSAVAAPASVTAEPETRNGTAASSAIESAVPGGGASIKDEKP
ncbi:MAG: 4Fe-4S binding protein [Candidatus Binataceae bacterium]|jgi:NADH-quinone oxidoreductase subunit I/NAD(P)H-quinone oxidoreductase subunit I